MTDIKKTTYQVAYQLGSRGSTHRGLITATRAAARAARRAHKSGDCQEVRVVATDYPADGTDPWGIERELTEREMVQASGE